jgi:hypothetical protein
MPPLYSVIVIFNLDVYLLFFCLVENTCKILVPVERKRILPFNRGRFTPFGKMKDHSSLKMYIWIMILHVPLFETIYIQLTTLSLQLNNADSMLECATAVIEHGYSLVEQMWKYC